MLKISRQQALQRWDTLPSNLKELIFSESAYDILYNVCEKEHLSEKKIHQIATIVGNVILGFIHAEDLAAEIRSELGIAPEIANAIAAEVDKKIFAPIRSDLEKNYAPASAEAAAGTPPVPEEPTAEAPVPAESVIDLKTKPGVEAGPLPAAPKEAVPTPPEPVIFEPKAPAPELTPTETVQFGVSTEPKKAPTEEAAEPAPFIIHKETELKPATGETTKKSLGGIFDFLKPKEKPSEVRPIEARIEMTGLEKFKKEAKPALTAKAEPPPTRVVHYTELRTPFSPVAPVAAPAEAPPKPFETPQGKPPIGAGMPQLRPQPPKEEVKKELPTLEIKRPDIPEAIDLRQPKTAEAPEAPMKPAMPPPVSPAEPKRVDFTSEEKIIRPIPVSQTPSPVPVPPTPPAPPSPTPPAQPKPEEKKPGEDGGVIDLRTFEIKK